MSQPKGLVLSNRAEMFGKMFAQAIQRQHWRRCEQLIKLARSGMSPSNKPIEWSVEELGLDQRIAETLGRHGVLWAQDLVTMPVQELSDLDGIGKFSLRAIRERLRLVKLTLADEK